MSLPDDLPSLFRALAALTRAWGRGLPSGLTVSMVIPDTARVTKAIEQLLAGMRANPKGVSFANAVKVAEHFFGAGRQSGTSHKVFKMPWPGDPRVNLQDSSEGAKPYRVRQLLAAIDRRGLRTEAAAEATERDSRQPATRARKGKRHG